MSSPGSSQALASILALVAALAADRDRSESARALAAGLGATAVIAFVHDAGVQTWLPAIGFPQFLPAGLTWSKLVATVPAAGTVRARLPYGQESEVEVQFVPAGPRCVLALAGYEGALDLEPGTRALLEVAGHFLAVEHELTIAQVGIEQARESALEAHSLASTVDRVRRDLDTAVRRERRRSVSLEHLARTALEMGRTSSIAGALDILATRSLDVLDALAVLVSLDDQTATPPTAVASSGGPEGFPEPWWAWLRQAPCPDSEPALRLDWPRLSACPTRASPDGVEYICVGMRDRLGSPLGFLRAYGRRGVTFGPDEEAMAVQLAQIGAAAVENAQLLQRANASERSARTQLELLQAITQSLEEGVIATDGERSVSFANRSAAALLTRSDAELKGVDIHGLIHPRCEADPACVLLAALTDAGARRVRFQLDMPRKDGSSFPATCVIGPILGGEGVHGHVLAFTDVGETRRLEEQVRLKQKLESIGVLAGGIAHDFNNLLTPILGNATLVAEELPPGGHLQEAIGEVVSAAERAAELTRQLLAYAGKGRLVLRVLDVSKVIATLEPLLAPAIPAGASLDLELAGTPCTVNADPGQLNQIVMNLVINAAEAMDPTRAGRVVVRTRTVDLRVEDMLSISRDPLSEPSPGRYALIEVQDNGVGMDDATRERIFEPFFTTKFTGRGLGLSAVLGIVRSHKGLVQLQSTPGLGSTIRIYLPFVEPERSRPVAPQPLAHADTATILVVDDEPSVRRFLRNVLQARGYRVIEADNGQAAIDLLPDQAIDLVLLDLAMPVMGGERTLEVLRQLRPQLPVIVSSGYHESDGIYRMTARPLVDFMPKPTTPRVLLEKVATSLRARNTGGS